MRQRKNPALGSEICFLTRKYEICKVKGKDLFSILVIGIQPYSSNERSAITNIPAPWRYFHVHATRILLP
jgi:hypothetical protein